MSKEHKQNKNNKHKPHSADYFVESRNHWWNQDFLELMAKRWDLSEVNSIVDVGCGIGHWGRTLEPYLNKTCTLIGVDREAEWVEKATEKAHQKDLHPRFSYVRGDAYQLPFESNSVDMVTCQTVLMHLGDPLKAIKEMKRILKPGGLIAVVEPNILCQSLIFDSLTAQDPVEDLIRSLSFYLKCGKGKQVLGEGFDACGDLVPGYFGKAGLKNIAVYISDKTWPWIPPYETEQEQLILKEWEEMRTKDRVHGAWEDETTKRYFIAGGGKKEEFEFYQGFFKETSHKHWDATQVGELDFAGGNLVYLISGRKGE